MIELPNLSSSRSVLRDTDNVVAERLSDETKNSSNLAPGCSIKARATKLLLGASCVASVAFLVSSALSASTTRLEDSSSLPELNNEQIHDTFHVNPNTLEPVKFHQSGFGAMNFHHHPDGLSKFRRHLESADIKIPVSAAPNAIPSLGEPNIINLRGHYVHDEHRSPYSAPVYDRPESELIKEQEDFMKKMDKVREEWGSWQFQDHEREIRPLQDFSKIPYKDVPTGSWTKGTWQTDKVYMENLIKEGRALVDRMTHAIYAELGYPTKGLSSEEVDEIEDKFRVNFEELDDDYDSRMVREGTTYLSQKAFDALALKLLHGMMTNDEFYFVLGGHSAAAGHGNNLEQQKTMQFNYIMEPVFHKLGMRLMSRNMAMGGLGTIHFSLGQAELYGETDFLMWDSLMTEKDTRDTHLFNRQAILKGERVPIIFSRMPSGIHNDTDGKAWMGDVIPGTVGLPLTTSEEQGSTLPWAVQYTNCAEGVQLCGGRGKDKWNTACWVERSDYPGAGNLGRPPMIQRVPQGQASWHPGWRVHQYESRKIALLFLKAFKKSFDIWENGMAEKGVPLHQDYWHVGKIYKDVQDTLQKNILLREGESQCESKYAFFNMSYVCRLKMHGMSGFTPVNRGYANSIIAHAKVGRNGFPKLVNKMFYTGPSLLPLNWKIPDGDVDVHAVAIASNYKMSAFDPVFEKVLEDEGETDDEAEEAENERRGLRQMSVANAARSLDEIVPGEGWASHVFNQEAEDEYCDGSAMSECNRSPRAWCYMYGNNDRHNCVTGDGNSGWLIINIPNVENGIILSKNEWWYPYDDWVMPEEAHMEDYPPTRKLGKVPPKPEDFFMDIAINGKIYKSMDREEYMANAQPEMAYNEAIFRLVNDKNIKGPVELGLRVRSASEPRKAGTSFCHIYWS